MVRFTKILRRIMGRCVPEYLRHVMIRRFVHVKREWPSPSLEIKIADTEDELVSAYRLLHDSYVESGFMNPHPSGLRVLPHHLLPQSSTVVAKWDGKVVATVSLIRDNPLGLPMEKIFNLADRRKGGRRLVEVSSLATKKSFRGKAGQVLFPLFRFIYQYSKLRFGCHEFVIAVNPSTVDMYRGLMCFERLEKGIRDYGFVKGAPAVGLYLNFETGEKRLRESPFGADLCQYWAEVPTAPQNKLPVRPYDTCSDPILTPELLKNLFLSKAQLIESLTLREIQIVLNAYDNPVYQDIFEVASFGQRVGVRTETQMKAEIGPGLQSGEVRNVSSQGLLLSCPSGELMVGQATYLAVWLNSSQKAEVRGRIRWKSADGIYGIQIFSPPPAWNQMIESISPRRPFPKINRKISKLS